MVHTAPVLQEGRNRFRAEGGAPTRAARDHGVSCDPGARSVPVSARSTLANQLPQHETIGVAAFGDVVGYRQRFAFQPGGDQFAG